MAPPGVFGRRTEPEMKRTKDAKEDNNEVKEDSQLPDPKADLLFACFPAEIQQQIWVEAVQKPACHSFKVVKSDYPSSRKWEIHLHALWPRHDPSAYRWWKSLLHCEPKNGGDDKLKNISFQTGFRHAMVNFQPICLRTKKHGYQLAAAINVETDLVIIDFSRGATAQPFTWFEHSTTSMDLNTIRHRMRHFKRVAIHYKASDSKAYKPGPFQCYCTSPSQLGCHRYKACCSELACFLDCFPELEEFYFVLEEPKGKAKTWTDEYKKAIRANRYCLAQPEELGGGTFEVSHFFDTKKEYIQHCPPRWLRSLGKNPADSPILGPGDRGNAS
ncbi:hypothetical protein SLS53_005744 [Cytospora paraplurivora]|uniref:Uncharacterized protein n=1 Tax=Cytospora paraplurivora TaxID=2898453 RepID=A0AAN9U579_9PEZI